MDKDTVFYETSGGGVTLSGGEPMWIRTPVIPGHTASAANIAALSDFIAAELPNVERWDLLAYTNLGQPKYHRLARAYALEGVPLLTRAEMEALHAVALQRIPVAVWSGATRNTHHVSRFTHHV